jgi:hypothetical protein
VFGVLSLHPDHLYDYFDEQELSLTLPADDQPLVPGTKIVCRYSKEGNIAVGYVLRSSQNDLSVLFFATEDGKSWGVDTAPRSRCIALNDFEYTMALRHADITGTVMSSSLDERLSERGRAIAQLNIPADLPPAAACQQCGNQLSILARRELQSMAIVRNKRKGKWIIDNFIDKQTTIKNLAVVCLVCNWREALEPDDINWKE